MDNMKLLVISDTDCDLMTVFVTAGIYVTRLTLKEATDADLSVFDAFCVLAGYSVPDARLRQKLENESSSGKRIFTEALMSFNGVYTAGPAPTVRKRLVILQPESGNTIEGVETGDLLDDCANQTVRPHYPVPGMKPILVYKDHILAHRHLNAPRDGILSESSPGLWTIGENIMMSSFRLSNFNRARFSPRKPWLAVIAFITEWLTGVKPVVFPEPIVKFGAGCAPESDNFDSLVADSVTRGITWLKRFLIDDGRGGIREGLRHDIDPDGRQASADTVRDDCTGESAGAFRMYSFITNDEYAKEISDNLENFVFGPMQIKGGMFDGMLRWSDTAWQVCYQDDVARSILSSLYSCLFMNRTESFPAVRRALDFLVKTTAKDGCRVNRTDIPMLDENSFNSLREAEHGNRSAHYNSYYHAALLLAHRFEPNALYLDTATRGLESIMALYPETIREQSETEELCRLILPLAALTEATGEEKHRKMLYRVTEDVVSHMHKSGGIQEWDTGYKAHCSRESRGECSLLTENGDPVADLLYSTNWLPLGFAYAHHVTGDKMFESLWRRVCSFCVNAQIKSKDPSLDGSWCRAFDMEINEVYGCPHDVGWAACCSETGWTDAEILMGLMLPYVLKAGKDGKQYA